MRIILNPKVNLTDKHKHIIKHSLGLTLGDTIYRNHYIADNSHLNYEELRYLVHHGYMFERDNVYRVTDFGIEQSHINFSINTEVPIDLLSEILESLETNASRPDIQEKLKQLIGNDYG